MEQYLKVGILTTSHGVRGEMKVYPTTDDLTRFKKLKEVFLESKDGYVKKKVESCRVGGDTVIIKLEGIESPEEARKYRQTAIMVDREHAVKLKKDEYFIADLIGLEVFDENDEHIGVLTEVIPTGANDVYQIEMDDKKELLLPAIKDCILDIDIEANKIKVHILDGLLDPIEAK